MPDLAKPRADIVLIGPIRAGKSTVGRLLADRLNVPQVSMDEHCWGYYTEIGFNETDADARGEDGMIASRFHLHALERLLSDYRECVIDLGAGHSVHRNVEDLTRMEELLANYPNVFLLLPSQDPERASEILAQRNVGNDWLQMFVREGGWNPNEHFLRHPSNAALAKHVVYTDGHLPESTCDQIIDLLLIRPRGSDKQSRTHSG